MSAASGTTLTANRNITANGTLALSGNNVTFSDAQSLFMSGLGTITGTGTITIGSPKTIPAGTTLTINPILAIANNQTVTNQGSLITTNNITGGNANSTWINDVNASLTMGGTTSSLMSTGTLTATALGNTISFNGSGNQTLKGTTYYNLTAGNAGTKTLGTSTVSNVLTLQGTATLSTTNSLAIGGQIVNNTSGTLNSTNTISFTGASASISGSGVNNFNNLIIDGSSNFTSNANTGKVIIAGTFTLDGTFDANTSDIIFSGTSSITGTNAPNFYHLIVNTGTLTLPAASDVFIDGDLTINSSLVPNTCLVVFAGNGNIQTIKGSTPNQTFYQLELANTSGQLQLQKPVVVTNVLILTDGIINTSSTNSMTLNNGAIITGGSSTSFINGPLIHVSTNTTSKVFPIGKGSDYRPVTLTINATGTANYTAELFDGPPTTRTLPSGVSHVSGIHYWNINQSSSVGFTNAIATLSYGANDEVQDPTKLGLVKDNGSGAWLLIGSGGSGSPSGSIAGTFTSFSTFTLANLTGGTNPLPVELVSFSARVSGEQVIIDWSTASELNNDFFTIERSQDGLSFEGIARIIGAGTTNQPMKYQSIDYLPLPGISYYRLKQTDFDGTFDYSKIVVVSFEGQFGFTAYPTVTQAILNLQVSGKRNDQLMLRLYDLKGIVRFEKMLIMNMANERVVLDQLDQLPRGLYILNISNSRWQQSARVIFN
jgi:hypothetical protein